MIKIKPINTRLRKIFEDDNFIQVKRVLENIQCLPKYSLLIDYLSTNGHLDNQKIKKLIIGNIDDMIEAINIIGHISENRNEGFNRLYKNFTERNLGKIWAEKLDVTVCPYCNRSYVFTLNKSGIRPHYDHFFPKSKYPYLAVSMYNLIPSCAVCNGAKSDCDTFDSFSQKENFIYPFNDAYGTHINFRANLKCDVSTWLGDTSNFEIEIIAKNGTDSNLVEKEIKTTDKLKLQELYTKHKDYVQDIIRITYIYNIDYFQSLVDSYPQIFFSVQDVENLIYMNYLDEENWDKRVLAKLTYDIKNQFQI